MAERPLLYGCMSCQLVYSLSIYYFKDDKAAPQVCPNCASHDIDQLGLMPVIGEHKDGGFYLTDKKRALGPFTDHDDARQGLWLWFAGGSNAEESSEQESTPDGEPDGGTKRPHLRLIRGTKEEDLAEEGEG